jgi:hypothetical protein
MPDMNISCPANFNGQQPVIDPADAVMLLIDHQASKRLFQVVKDMPMTQLRTPTVTLAKIATLSSSRPTSFSWRAISRRKTS